MFVIVRYIKMNRRRKTLYHESLELSTNNSVMNVYTEHLTSKQEKALRFYDIEEAWAMLLFVGRDKLSTGKIIEVDN